MFRSFLSVVLILSVSFVSNISVGEERDGVISSNDDPDWNTDMAFQQDWPEGTECGTQEEMLAKLNVLADDVICRTAVSLAACATLIGAAGTGAGIAANRAARRSAGMSATRAPACSIADNQYEFFENEYFVKFFDLFFEMMVVDAHARQVVCASLEMRNIQRYLAQTHTGLGAVIDNERAALRALVNDGYSPDLSHNSFTTRPADADAFNRYADGLLQEIRDNPDVGQAGWRDSAMERIEDFKSQLANGDVPEGRLVTHWDNLREAVGARIGFDERQALEVSASRRASAASAERFAPVREILLKESRYLPEADRMRLQEFQRANPSLAGVIDEAIEARYNLGAAVHTRREYGSAMKTMRNPSRAQEFRSNPSALRNFFVNLPHLDLPETNASLQRLQISSGLSRYDTREMRKGRTTNGFRNTDLNRGHGSLSHGRRAMLASGSRLGARFAAGAVAGPFGVAVAGAASAAEVVVGATALGCGEIYSQFQVIDSPEGGCGDTSNINHPTTQQFLTMPPEMQLSEMANHPRMCAAINEIYNSQPGPHNFEAECGGEGGFILTSKGRGAQDLEINVRYGDTPGQIQQINLWGDGLFDKGGPMGLRFDAQGNFVQARAPLSGGAWAQAMMNNPEEAMSFSNPDLFVPISRSNIEGNSGMQSVVANQAGEALSYLSTTNAMVTEVSACCTGRGHPGAERCGAYGINDVPSSPSTDEAPVESDALMM